MLDIKGKKIAVLCDTEEKVEKFYEAFGMEVNEWCFSCFYPYRLYMIIEENGRIGWDSCGKYKLLGYKLITFDEFMNGKVEIKKEEKKVNKFKVGDIVRILDGSKIKDYTGGFVWGMKQNIGKLATISKIETRGKRYCYSLVGHGCLYDERGLELVSQSPIKTLTITTSDTITTLTDGQHTTTINRFYKDTNDEKVAVSEVVKKYYAELDEIERASRMPKVGDTVKVIDNGRTYSTYDTWLIANNIDIKHAIKWTTSKSPKNDSIYKIVAIHKHLDSRAMLALIEDDYNCYIINIEGLEVLEVVKFYLTQTN